MVAREDRRSNHRQLWTRSIFRFHYIQKAFIPLPIKVRIVELMLQSYVGIIPIHPGFGPTPVQSNVNTPKVNINIRQTESPTRDGRPSFMAFHEMIGRDGWFRRRRRAEPTPSQKKKWRINQSNSHWRQKTRLRQQKKGPGPKDLK